MIIRKLTSNDLAEFRAIRIEMCAAHPEAFDQTADEANATPDEKLLEWMSQRAEFPENFVLAAFEGDRIKGVAGFHREDTFKLRHRALVWSVYVQPEARGLGLGKLLMTTLIDEARAMKGLEFLTLEVSLTQTSARSLYASLGFVTVGLVTRLYKLQDNSYVDSEEMILQL